MISQVQQIETVTGAASQIIESLQTAIFSTMQAAAEGVETQAKMAQAFQRLEAQEAILDWLIQRRIDQERRLDDAHLRPAQRTMIDFKIGQIDEQLTALLTSTGIDDTVASEAVGTLVEEAAKPHTNGVKRNGHRRLAKAK